MDTIIAHLKYKDENLFVRKKRCFWIFRMKENHLNLIECNATLSSFYGPVTESKGSLELNIEKQTIQDVCITIWAMTFSSYRIWRVVDIIVNLDVGKVYKEGDFFFKYFKNNHFHENEVNGMYKYITQFEFPVPTNARYTT